MGLIAECAYPKSKLNSVTDRVHICLAPNSKHNKHMTCGVQSTAKINEANTKILANLRRDLNVDVCGNGRSLAGFSTFCLAFFAC